jgi:Uma2 family endonuclease
LWRDPWFLGSLVGFPMSVSAQHITAEQLLRTPRDGFRYELVAGELKKMSPAGSEHGAIVMNLAYALRKHVVEMELGIVFGAETGFLLSRNPDTVRAPDIAYVRKERIPSEGLPRTFWPGAPDLAVEVVSPSDTVSEIDEKIEAWLSAGCLAVWIVDPRLQTVTVHRSVTDIHTLTVKDALDGGQVVPGFQCPVRDVFVTL